MNICERQHLACWLDLDPIGQCQHVHILAVQFPVEKFIATKSRTVFCSGIENALPFSRANQNALEEPPSRFNARSIFKSSANCNVARTFANSESEIFEQTPSSARSFVPVAAKVRRARCESSKPRTCFSRSTRNGPH